MITTKAPFLKTISSGGRLLYQVAAKLQFCGSHRLRDYPGKCQRLHGHNWEVEAAVSGSKTDRLGMLVDFGQVKEMMNGILDELDHRDLNSLPAFADQNPTAENLSRYLYERLKERIGAHDSELKVDWVRVWETPGCSASFWEDSR